MDRKPRTQIGNPDKGNAQKETHTPLIGNSNPKAARSNNYGSTKQLVHILAKNIYAEINKHLLRTEWRSTKLGDYFGQIDFDYRSST